MYIMVNKKIDGNDVVNNKNDLKLNVSPNPANLFANVSFSTRQLSPVSLQLLNINGTLINQVSPKQLPEGSYTYRFDVHTLSPGSYIIKVSSGGESANKIFIKL